MRHGLDGPAERDPPQEARPARAPLRRLRRPLPLPERANGQAVMPDLVTGDLAKGSATSDPDGYPLYYAGSRDNDFRIVATRPAAADGPLVDERQDERPVQHLEQRLGRRRARRRRLPARGRRELLVLRRQAQPRLRRQRQGHGRPADRPDGAELGRPARRRFPPTDAFSIENSVAFRSGVVYFANSAGSSRAGTSATPERRKPYRRMFRFWTGDDTDASIVIDDKGFLYVASELEKFTVRSQEVGQLMKLNPYRKGNPFVWSRPADRDRFEGSGGLWSTPALDRGMLYVSTNAGGLARRRPQDGPRALEDSAARPDLGLAGRGGQRPDRGRLHGHPARVGRVQGGQQPPELWRLKLDDAASSRRRRSGGAGSGSGRAAARCTGSASGASGEEGATKQRGPRGNRLSAVRRPARRRANRRSRPRWRPPLTV